MTTIRNQEDLLRALSENLHWKEAVRAQILGEELLQLPARFNLFVEQMTSFVAGQERHNAEIAQSVTEIKTFIAKQERHNADISRTLAELIEMNRNITGRQNRIDWDNSWLKGRITQDNAIKEADMIALELGLRHVRNVTREEMFQMALKAAGGKELTGELKSFRRADLVIEARDGEATQYIAVEASFIGGNRDVSRALRNARLLAELTGQPALAAIASVRNYEPAERQIASGAIHWHEMEEPEPEME